jgi:hypothetical protein
MKERSYVPAVGLVYCCAFLDEVEEVFVWLEQRFKICSPHWTIFATSS